eukprot:470309-Prymnesium_polylepis.2
MLAHVSPDDLCVRLALVSVGCVVQRPASSPSPASWRGIAVVFLTGRPSAGPLSPGTRDARTCSVSTVPCGLKLYQMPSEIGHQLDALQLGNRPQYSSNNCRSREHPIARSTERERPVLSAQECAHVGCGCGLQQQLGDRIGG